MNNQFTFVDLFSGIGGFRIGFEKAGFKCVMSSEINNYCKTIYQKNFGEIPLCDVTKIPLNAIPDHDVLTAGFPCQPFSICGKKRGFEDTRGTLFFHICEIINAKQPKVVLLENVKHLIHHDKGNTLTVILNSLEELGYHVTTKLLNAKNFGMPQNRERIIIFATKAKPFNFSKCRFTNTKALESFLDNDNGDFEFLNNDEYTLIENPVTQKESGLIFVGYRNKAIRKAGVRKNTEHLSRVHKQPNRIYSVKGTHPTLPSQESSGRFFIYLPNKDAVRKLTIKECYRIMGFPENFKISDNKSEAYKQIGNSVCVPMVTELATQILNQQLLTKKLNMINCSKIQKPALFGINQSNRDFTQKDTWGKNQFNSSFPTALACYMASQNLAPVYLKLDNHLKITHSIISTEQLFGINPASEDLFFAFESDYTPYQQLVIGNLPRIDLVIQDIKSSCCLRGLEIKLTALPDNATCDLADNKFGSEIVIRPDSIVYLASSIAMNYRLNTNNLKNLLGTDFNEIKDWTDGREVMPYIPKMIAVLDKVLLANLDKQEPLIMQPIWKTIGKSSQLENNCLDIFVWSNFSFTRLFLNVAIKELRSENKITRQLRSVIWLLKMLLDFSNTEKIHHTKIIDELSYNTKNDKAFAVSGKVSHPFMTCAELTKPRITKDEIKNIILGNGHLLLSPERRFDAIIYNSSDLFN